MEIKVIIISLVTLIYYSSNAQNDHVRGPCGEIKSIILVQGGILFEPIEENQNPPDSILCSSYEEEFYLNGIQINKDQFSILNLSHKDLTSDSTTFFSRRSSKVGYGTYQYHYKNGKICSDKITYHVEVKLPIFLDGIEVNKISGTGNFSGINVLVIRRQKGLFNADEIYIESN